MAKLGFRGRKKEDDSVYFASQWGLIFRRFKKHKLAIVSLWILGAFYFVAVFCEFLAPSTPEFYNSEFQYMPPQKIHWIDAEGRFHLQPFVYRIQGEMNRQTFQRDFVEDTARRVPVRLFAHGSPYKMWGFLRCDIHLFGPSDPKAPFYLLGSDSLGRDLFSSIVYGTRISLSVGLIGVFLSFLIGVTVGSISGYFGGIVDSAIQRFIELLRSFPAIPLWLTLSAALPDNMDPLLTYFAITVILSFLHWTGLARVVRSKLLSLKNEDFVTAAKVAGQPSSMIMAKHLIPGCLSYLIVNITLAIPGMILGETSLSFLGLGLRAPVVSWGVLLSEGQKASVLILYPWLIIPVVPVIISVMAFNFLGDGLRDAADPYK